MPFLKEAFAEATTKALRGEEDGFKKINTLAEDIVIAIGSPDQVQHLQEIPVPEKIQTHLGSEGTGKILGQLPSLVDRDLKIIKSVMDNIYVGGWHKARNVYQEMQNKYKDQFLYGDLLPAYATQLAKIDSRSDFVKSKVSRETWENYVQLSKAIKAAFARNSNN